MQSTRHHINQFGHRQAGAALFMALIFLLILTILGVFGMNVSRLENLMAGNAQFQTTALNNAEYTLARGVEDILKVESDGIAYPTGAGYHTVGDYDPSDLVWNFTTKTVSLPDGSTGKYVILNAGTDNDDGEDSSYNGTINPAPGAIVQVFLVTAQSESSRGAKRIVQSVVVTDPLVP
jgi:type IV pilus assembly protein PilX